MKRFTDTGKWRDAWVRKLSTQAKMLWIWIVDNCDGAGVFELDLELASFDAGLQFTRQHFDELQSRISPLGNGKFWIPKFIAFQYGPTLSAKCVPHLRVLELLKSHGITTTLGGTLGGTLDTTLDTTLVCTLKTRQDKTRQDKEEDKDNTEKHLPECNGRPTLSEVLAKADMIGLAAWKAEDWFHEMEGCGWLDYAKRPIHDWTAVLTRIKAKWEADGRPAGLPKAKAQTTAETPFALNVQHQAIVEEIKRIEANSCKDPFGRLTMEPDIRKRYRELRAKAIEVRTKLQNLT